MLIQFLPCICDARDTIRNILLLMIALHKKHRLFDHLKHVTIHLEYQNNCIFEEKSVFFAKKRMETLLHFYFDTFVLNNKTQ